MGVVCGSQRKQKITAWQNYEDLRATRDICSLLQTNEGITVQESDVNLQYLVLGERLGEGTFGSVIKAARHKDRSRVFALKKVKRSAEVEDKNIMREIDIWSSLDHPFIARCYEAYANSATYHLVVELCNGGDLVSKVAKLSAIPESTAKEIIFKVLKAVSYLHEHGISHRDIKPDNFLFTDVGDESQTDVKLVDFGLSKRYQTAELKTMVGTAYYVAPEVFDGPYTAKVDNWAVGITIYVLLCGKPPFWGSNNYEILEAAKANAIGKDDPKWDKMSSDAKNLITGLLLIDPSARMSIKTALEHPWFESVRQRIKTSANANSRGTIKERIMKFIYLNPVQHAVLMTWVKNSDIHAISQELEDFFIHLDKDHLGRIYPESINEWFKESEVEFTQKETAEFCTFLAENKTSVLSYSQLIAMVIDATTMLASASSVKDLFDLATGERDCRLIETDKLAYKLKSNSFCGIAKPLIEQILKRASAKSNTITFSNFCNIMSSR